MKSIFKDRNEKFTLDRSKCPFAVIDLKSASGCFVYSHDNATTFHFPIYSMSLTYSTSHRSNFYFAILWMKTFFYFDFNHQLFILSRMWYKLFIYSHNYRYDVTCHMFQFFPLPFHLAFVFVLSVWTNHFFPFDKNIFPLLWSARMISHDMILTCLCEIDEFIKFLCSKNCAKTIKSKWMKYLLDVGVIYLI